jgi:hypothetical protein
VVRAPGVDEIQVHPLIELEPTVELGDALVPQHDVLVRGSADGDPLRESPIEVAALADLDHMEMTRRERIARP